MELKQVIDRLNELYQRSQQAKLTEEELDERNRLRRIYLDAIRGQVKASLEEVKPMDKTASDQHHEHCGCNCGQEGHHHH